MTNQETFDIVYRGLRGQKFVQSLDPKLPGLSQCAYRGPKGRKCGAGHLIPDNKYVPEMEGESVWGEHVEPVMVALGVELDFTQTLQDAHDSGCEPEDMEHRLRDVAKMYELEIPDDNQDQSSCIS